MCEPTTIMMVGMAVASAYQLNETRKSAKRQKKFANAAAKEKQSQIHASKSAAADDRQRRMRRERARLRAASAETGLGGISTDTLINNAEFQGGFDIAKINLSEDFALTNSMFENQSNLNQIQQPDYIGTALNTGLQLYGMNANAAAAKAAQPVSSGPPTVPI